VRRKPLISVISILVTIGILISVSSIWKHKTTELSAQIKYDLEISSRMTVKNVKKVVNTEANLGGTYLEPDIYGVPTNPGTGMLRYYLDDKLHRTLNVPYQLITANIYSQANPSTHSVIAYTSSTVKVPILFGINTQITEKYQFPDPVKKLK
jgi:hypothetical protein